MMLEFITRPVRKNLVGCQFGTLTVKSYVGHATVGEAVYWLVECDCGTSRTIRNSQLTRGCPNCRPVGNKHYAWQGYGELPRSVYTTIRHGAAARGFEFNVSIEYLWDLFVAQDRKCVLTNWPIGFNKTYRAVTTKTASLDRIDSTKGYVEGNLQWVHRDINKAKKNIPDDYFIRMCLAVADCQSSR
jgi:hypothetical protein